jgi:SulP family sulfate permease
MKQDFLQKTAAVLTTGIICGLISTVAAISFAGMIFSGPLAQHVGVGIGIALFSAALVGLLSALAATYPGSISVLHGTVSAILALMVVTIAERLPPSATPSETLATALVAIAFCTVLAGLLFLLVGSLRLGKVIRFIPYPVICGFMAGTGWLLVLGGVRLMAGGLIEGHGVDGLFTRLGVLVVLPGMVFAVLLLIVETRVRHFAVLPLAMAVAIGVFYLAAAAFGVDAGAPDMAAFFLDVTGKAPLFKPLHPGLITVAHWDGILNALPDIGSILLISTLSLLLHASSIELMAERDINLDTELRIAGAANMLSGIAGGMIGYNSLPYTMIGHSMGVVSRWIGVVSALVCAVTMLFGTGLTAMIPRPVLGGLLLYLGLKLLVEWAVDSRRKLPAADYVITLVILLVIAGIGFLEGVGIGIMAGIVIFVINYSRIDVVKNQVSAESYRSNVDRTSEERLLLMERGRQIRIMVLQGFIFFGTANGIFNRIKADVGANPGVKFVILDFRRVSGLDTTGVISFVKMLQLASQKGYCVIFTQVPPSIDHVFRTSEYPISSNVCMATFPDLDRGLEYCENELIQAAAASETDGSPQTLTKRLAGAFPKDIDRRELLKYLERKTIRAGTELIQRGAVSKTLYLVDAGKVSAIMALDNGSSVRLRTMHRGAVIGEIGMYLGLPRTASIVAEEDAVIYELTAEALARMEAASPDIALQFHRFIARLMCQRLIDTNNMLQVVLE